LNSETLYNGAAGNFQSNYFLTNLESRNLVGCSFGPALKSFPFYDDAFTIYTAIQNFMTAFVNSYYTSELSIIEDIELLSWIVEANLVAKVKDFPVFFDTTTLIDVLTHVAYLSSVVHHTLNSKELGDVTGSLPFHPMSFALPVPTAKGVTDVVPYLPGIALSLGQIVFSAIFTRPQFYNSSFSLTHMFSNATFLAGTNSQTNAAAATFLAAMDTMSDEVAARTFDSQGLSQGMPFVWKTLDPRKEPFHLMA